MKTATKLILAGAAGVGALFALQASKRLSFAGKSVVITGGSRGLGLVMAREFAREGAKLTLLARTERQLQRAARELREEGAEVLAIVCDVREREQVEEAVGRAAAHFGGVDVLVNNAGVISVGPLEHMTARDFEGAMAVHFWGPLYAMLAAVPYMQRQGGGRIVNIASLGGKVALPHLVPYSASKFALVGLSDGVRAELAKDGILVTTVCPGLMRTGGHVNAEVKGDHEREFTLFALLDSLPLLSVNTRYAARRIIAACRRGAPSLIFPLEARVGAAANALAPSLTAELAKLALRLLPPSVGAEGAVRRRGEEIPVRAPSFFTRLSDLASKENNETA